MGGISIERRDKLPRNSTTDLNFVPKFNKIILEAHAKPSYPIRI